VCPEIGQETATIKVLRFAADISHEGSRNKMEIAPIPGIRALPVVKAPQGDFRPPEVFDINGSAPPGDGDRQRGGRKASGAEENDEEDLIEDDLMLEAEAESSGMVEENSARSVDYFA
jgi:hypothetical protein